MTTPSTTAPDLRITQAVVEAVLAPAPSTLRVTQAVVEAVLAPPPSTLRVTQAFVEAVLPGAPIVAPQSAYVIVGDVGVPAPTFAQLTQVGAYVQAVAALPRQTSASPLVTLNLYRAPSALGPWMLVDTVPVSPISALNNLFDINPGIGHMNYYAVTVVDATGAESAQSAVLSIAPQAT